MNTRDSLTWVYDRDFHILNISSLNIFKAVNFLRYNLLRIKCTCLKHTVWWGLIRYTPVKTLPSSRLNASIIPKSHPLNSQSLLTPDNLWSTLDSLSLPSVIQGIWVVKSFLYIPIYVLFHLSFSFSLSWVYSGVFQRLATCQILQQTEFRNRGESNYLIWTRHWDRKM